MTRPPGRDPANGLSKKSNPKTTPTEHQKPNSHNTPPAKHIPQSETQTQMKATWNGATIAESDDTVLVEGNHYFPMSSLNRDVVTFSNHKTTCPWKGSANYYSLLVNGELNTDAAWYYADPKPEAEMVRDRVAFWKDVKVTAS